MTDDDQDEFGSEQRWWCASDDLGAQPGHRRAAAEVDDRRWHISAAGLVVADVAAVGETGSFGRLLGTRQVVDLVPAMDWTDLEM